MKLIYAFVVLLGVFLSIAADVTAPEKKNEASESLTSSSKTPKQPSDSVTDKDKTTSSVKSTEPSSTLSPFTKPTSIPPVTPSPNKTGDWNVTENNSTCIRITGFISLNVTVKGADNKTSNQIINIPPNTTAHGSCKNETIIFENSPDFILQLQFALDKTNKNFVLSQVDGLVHVEVKGTKEPIHFQKNVSSLATPLDKSYVCKQPEKIELNNGVVLEFKGIRIQAFKNSTSNEFDSEYECTSDVFHTPDIVPIIVGCALAILVVLVLVAYLISRRRSQARGYLSM